MAQPYRTLVVRVTQEQFEWLEKKADELGFSPSGYAKYQTLDGYPGAGSIPVPQLIQEMATNLDLLPKGKTFMVSSLLDPEKWWALNRSEKSQLIHWLTKEVERKGYPSIGQMPNKTNIYKKQQKEDPMMNEMDIENEEQLALMYLYDEILGSYGEEEAGEAFDGYDID